MKSLNLFLGKLMTFEQSQIATGTKQLLSDVSTWLLVLVPIVGTVVLVYLAIRRSSADQQDKKQWDDRIKTTIVSIAIGLLASAIVGIISSYYGAGG